MGLLKLATPQFKRLAMGLVLAAMAAVVLPSARAQKTDASLSGIVQDVTGSAIQGATIRINSLETGTERDVETDSDGRYHAPSLAVGRYELTADKTGFRTEHRTGITLVVGQQAEVNLTLRVGDVHQTVEVSSEAAVVVVATEDASGLVGERQVKELPLNGRSYDQLLTLNPGIVNYTSQRAGGIGTSNSVVGNMFAASGHRPQENLFLLNGVEYTSASEINNTPGGTSGQLLGVDAVREFEVVKDTYGAEYGKRPGAQVSIVTASGCRNSSTSAPGTTRMPSGLLVVEASLATNLVVATPTEQVRPYCSRMSARISWPMAAGRPSRRMAPLTSRNASSRDSGSTSGVTSRNRVMISRDTAA